MTATEKWCRKNLQKTSEGRHNS